MARPGPGPLVYPCRPVVLHQPGSGRVAVQAVAGAARGFAAGTPSGAIRERGGFDLTKG